MVPKVTLCQVAVIDKLTIDSCQLINSLLEMEITNGIPLQKWMAFWIEKGRH